MAEIDQADQFNSDRGYTDWSALTVPQKSAALLRAEDYILENYRLRDDLSEDDLGRLSVAKFTLARALGNKPEPIAAERVVVKESKELSGMKKSVEYADTPGDPFPSVTRWLAPLLVPTVSAGYRAGRMARR